VKGVALLPQAARIAAPYVLAALGGACSERSGVINIALEGILLAGAFGAAAATLAWHSAALGVCFGIAAGMALAAIYGAAVIVGRADQIVCGVAATLLALGATRFFLKLLFGSTSNSPRIVEVAPTWAMALLLVGAAAAVQLWLYRTRSGLRLRAVGEHPEAALTVGVAPRPLRWAGVLASGALGGLGGVWLAFDQHGFVAGMSAGRGYIALAAMILGRWTPLGAIAACLLFGACEAVELALQASGAGLPSGLVQSIPYLATIAALAARSIRRNFAPKALGKPL
jgi:simple sugar transport system permease protein